MYPFPHGQARLWSVDEGGRWSPRTPYQKNQIQHDWGYIACLLFGAGLPQYRLSCLYMEFANVAAPGNTVSAPAFDQGAGVEYYQGLSGNMDYLRLFLSGTPAVEVAPGFESFFTAGVDGNQLTFYAQSAGSAGWHGLPFSDSANSVVYGLALVAAPDRSDASRDVVFGRLYYDALQQQPKEASRQIGASWQQQFTGLTV